MANCIEELPIDRQVSFMGMLKGLTENGPSQYGGRQGDWYEHDGVLASSAALSVIRLHR